MSGFRNLEPCSFSLVLTTQRGVVTRTFTTPESEDKQDEEDSCRADDTLTHRYLTVSLCTINRLSPVKMCDC